MASLTTALTDRSADVKHARLVLEYARLIRVTCGSRTETARALQVAHLAINTVRLSNMIVSILTDDLTLCELHTSNSACVCVPPF